MTVIIGGGNALPVVAHKSTHATGGSDALAPADIGAVATSDARLTDARAPLPHLHPTYAVQEITATTGVYMACTAGTEVIRLYLNPASGSAGLNVPSGAVFDGQLIWIMVQAVGASRTMYFHPDYEISPQVPTRQFSMASGSWDFFTIQARVVGGVTTWRLIDSDQFPLVAFPPITLTFATTLNSDQAQGTAFRATVTASFTLANPINAVDGQRSVYEFVNNSGSATYTITLGSLFEKLSTIDATLSIPPGKVAFLTVVWNASRTKFTVLGYDYTA